MRIAILFFGLILTASQSFASDAIVKALGLLEGEKYSMSISRVEVKGSNARAMLEDYATRVKGFEEDYTVSLRLSAEQLPEVDGDDVVGLARIIDVADYITNPTGSGDHSEAEDKRRFNEVRSLLFKVRDMGGLVGAESHSWNTCGVTFPGVIILDVKAKEVISISPDNTDC